LSRIALRVSPRTLGLVALAILSFSIATGIGLAMFNTGRFSQVQAAFSAFVPGRSGGSSCH